MIHESHEWKKLIKRNCNYVKRHLDIINDEIPHEDKLQISLTINALLARRLMETPKIESKYIYSKISVVGYPWKGKTVNYRNWHAIEDKYQLKNPNRRQILVSRLFDIMIHSWVWLWAEDDNKVDGFLISSDNTKHKLLYHINVKDITEVFENIASSYPTDIRFRRTESGEIEWDCK